MKRLMRTALLILIGVTMTTVILDKGEINAKQKIIDKVEEALEEYIIPDYELEVVDEYIYAMEGFMC